MTEKAVCACVRACVHACVRAGACNSFEWTVDFNITKKVTVK